MSTLQISLAIVGALVLLAVVVHSAWSSRRNLPKRPVAEAAPRQEPAGVVNPEEAPAAGEPAHRQEPSFDTDTDTALSALAKRTIAEKRPALDALIDAMAAVVLMDSLVSGDAALAALPSTLRAGSKPFGVEGLSASTGEWEFPVAGQRYSAFQCGVQLANRTGALNQIEYSEFVIKAQAFADALGAEAEFPDMLDEVARARELDQFASGHDAQLSFTLRAKHTAWSPGYVQQSAGRIGFVAGAMPGRMVLPTSQPGHAPILGLLFDTQAAMADDPEQSALREITLFLDVPQVLRTEQPFVRMCEAALALATSMDGAIIDDNGNLIRAEAMEAIHADLEQLYDTLDARELAAGSALGRRVFS